MCAFVSLYELNKPHVYKGQNYEIHVVVNGKLLAVMYWQMHWRTVVGMTDAVH